MPQVQRGTKGQIARERRNKAARELSRKLGKAATAKPAAGPPTYRRPDGSTYQQYGGPKSRQDVLVPDTSKIVKAMGKFGRLPRPY
jgi:hypothetical protein